MLYLLSGDITQQQYLDLVNYYESLYSDIVDEQDETKGKRLIIQGYNMAILMSYQCSYNYLDFLGLNNFAEQSIALTTGFRNGRFLR